MNKLIGVISISMLMLSFNVQAIEVGVFCLCAGEDSEEEYAENLCAAIQESELEISRMKTGTPSQGVRFPVTVPNHPEGLSLATHPCNMYVNGTASCTRPSTGIEGAPNQITAYPVACSGQARDLRVR